MKQYTFDNIVSSSEAFQQVLETAKKAADTDANVYIFGETGTGKELVAQSIHYSGNRKKKPFLAQNCAAVPASLFEGIMFGTERGGFTGATERPGLFEQAEGGTLLLDEISAMPYGLQGKLLRVVQENYVRRIGGTRDIPINVRIIATANEEAQTLISTGKLRKDLYFRLSIVNLNLPPLRERGEDVALLSQYFLKKYCKSEGKEIKEISEEAKAALKSYEFPGNVRQLENMIRAAVSLCEDSELSIKDLDLQNLETKEKCLDSDIVEKGLEEALGEMEKRLIAAALEKTGNNVTQTAELLKIKRQALQYKMKKYQFK